MRFHTHDASVVLTVCVSVTSQYCIENVA